MSHITPCIYIYLPPLIIRVDVPYNALYVDLVLIHSCKKNIQVISYLTICSEAGLQGKIEILMFYVTLVHTIWAKLSQSVFGTRNKRVMKGIPD